MGCVTSQGAGVGGGCICEWWGLRRTSEILFWNMVWLSLKWLLVVYAKIFHCVKECSLAMVLQHLHSVVNGVEGVIMFSKLLGKFGSVAVGSKCVLVFVKPNC